MSALAWALLGAAVVASIGALVARWRLSLLSEGRQQQAAQQATVGAAVRQEIRKTDAQIDAETARAVQQAVDQAKVRPPTTADARAALKDKP